MLRSALSIALLSTGIAAAVRRRRKISRRRGFRRERATGVEPATSSLGNRVHYLNPTAVLILELCNGQVPTRDLPSLVQAAYDLTEPPDAEVAQCLQKRRTDTFTCAPRSASFLAASQRTPSTW
jgi:hypothetical protein